MSLFFEDFLDHSPLEILEISFIIYFGVLQNASEYLLQSDLNGIS